MINSNLFLTIGWLYPDLMSTYGDRGNVTVLMKRLEWRKIKVNLKKISIAENADEILKCDLLFMGGAQDIQQEIVNRDLMQIKGKYFIQATKKGIPSLLICGAYQFMGKYYKTADGKILKGLGLFDLFTESQGIKSKRLIGDIIIKPNIQFNETVTTIIGFENHGGRTYLKDKSQAFGRVIKGEGNNGTDGTEGIRFRNAIGTYLHGPILPKNPQLADYLLEKALEVKYKKKITLPKLDDTLADKAKEIIIKRLRVQSSQ